MFRRQSIKYSLKSVFELFPVAGLIVLFQLSNTTMVSAKSSAFEQGKKFESVPAVLALRDRVEPANAILLDRLNNLLPELMLKSKLDMWLVIAREYEEDALFFSLVPHTTFAARRTTMLVFAKNKKGEIERFTISRYPISGYYDTRWEGGSLSEQWQRLAEIIKEYDPKSIGINQSEHWPLADGLTHGLYQLLTRNLEETYINRLVSAEPLVIRWLETRTEKELQIYPHIVAIARSVIAEAFSNKVITPGATTTDDVAWFIREKFESLQLPVWFQPYVNIQREGDKADRDAPFLGRSNLVIQPGDVLHTDVGICYLKLCTDTQEMGYVLKLGEQSVPKGLINALAVGNRWQDIFTDNFKTGSTGNQILAKTRQQLANAKIYGSTYTHPIGFVGHAIGPTIGMWDNQDSTPVRGDWPLYANTAYAIEGNVKVKVPEWNEQWVQIKLEQSAVFDGKRVIYLAGRQTEWHVVR